MSPRSQLVIDGLELELKQSFWGLHPSLLYPNALSATHPFATASCVRLESGSE